MSTYDLKGKSVAVYCASSSGIPPVYFEAARQLGSLLGQSGASLIYGGTKVGLMGTVADAVIAVGGPVVGVIPALLNEEGIAHANLSELVLTDGMRERKAIMEERADAFVVLPGGYGTWEEFFEILTLKQLGYHNKAIVVLNTNGYYTTMLELFQTATDQGFMKPSNLTLFQVVATPDEALSYLASYQPTSVESKWVRRPAPPPQVGEIPGSE